MRVFIVDDHEIIRLGITDLLNIEPDLEVVGEASSVDEAMVRVPATRPDIAVLDVRLADGNGVELCRDLRSLLPELRCLMLTSFADHEALFDALLAGAAGFVLKQIAGTELVTAIRTVGAGKSLLDTDSTAALLAKLRRQDELADPLHKLTDQERVVLDLIGEGMTNRQIAQSMHLAEKTIKNYVSNLLPKLGLQRRVQAAVLATKIRHQRESRNEH